MTHKRLNSRRGKRTGPICLLGQKNITTNSNNCFHAKERLYINPEPKFGWPKTVLDLAKQSIKCLFQKQITKK